MGLYKRLIESNRNANRNASARGDAFSISFSGLDDLIARFDRLDQRIQRQIINKAGLPILKDIRHSAKYYMIQTFGRMKRSGKNVGFNMAESLGFKRSTRRGMVSISLAVIYSKAATNKLSHLIEWGFMHRFAKRRVQGHFNMTRAFDDHKEIAVERFRMELRRMLDQAEGGERVS